MFVSSDNHFVKPVNPLVGFANHGNQLIPYAIDPLVRLIDPPVRLIDPPALVNQVRIDAVKSLDNRLELFSVLGLFGFHLLKLGQDHFLG